MTLMYIISFQVIMQIQTTYRLLVSAPLKETLIANNLMLGKVYHQIDLQSNLPARIFL